MLGFVVKFEGIRGSSNGRTTGFGPVNWGSNPYPRTKIRTSRKRCFYFGSELTTHLPCLSKTANILSIGIDTPVLPLAQHKESDLKSRAPNYFVPLIGIRSKQVVYQSNFTRIGQLLPENSYGQKRVQQGHGRSRDEANTGTAIPIVAQSTLG